MEQLNKSGNRRGLHGNNLRGAKNSSAKGWILYRDDEEIGFFATLSELAEETGKSRHYMWMMARGKAMNVDGPRQKTKEGWSIKPAMSIQFSNK
jgi:hypothetical protein